MHCPPKLLANRTRWQEQARRHIHALIDGLAFAAWGRSTVVDLQSTGGAHPRVSSYDISTLCRIENSTRTAPVHRCLERNADGDVPSHRGHLCYEDFQINELCATVRAAQRGRKEYAT